MKLQAILDRLKTDFHIPVALAVFAVTTAYHFWTKQDLGPNYVNSLYAMYAFLGGHALGQMKWANGGDAAPAADPDKG